MSEATAPAPAATQAAPAAAEPATGTTKTVYNVNPNLPFLKKLNAIKTPEERIGLINQLRHQLELAEKEKGSFAEHLRAMHAKDAALAAKSLKDTIAAATNGDMQAAAVAVKMSSIKPEDQKLALKHLQNMDAENQPIKRLITLSMIEQHTQKLLLNQLCLHMENVSAAVQVLAIQQKALFTLLGIEEITEEAKVEATKESTAKAAQPEKADKTNQPIPAAASP